MAAYEIEIKSLLGGKNNADNLITKMKADDPNFQSLGPHKQQNHYFSGSNTVLLYSNIVKHVEKEKKENLKNLCEQAKDYSIRTANRDGRVLLIIKASIDDTTSSNGTARIELESEVDLSLEELDKLILDSGFHYQAKWSRERQEFKYKDMNVSIDKNAGYGYLAEFEKIISDPDKAENTKTFIRDCMNVLGLQELPQDRLERMFAYYNQNWQDYYGTEKTFNID
ncbi:MAG: hypothetical protein HYW51_02320 [Candidatus Doudnabacteria bacterium]|nr:hypothetical protein [Candidatus Doudnabacteria bacterium]